ncbi:MAG: autoinducer binding domain-containing protein [Rhodobacteraceae bacterium]|nr:autoinducer binding domain-containing protein [Paracoccaceae bacterium]
MSDWIQSSLTDTITSLRNVGMIDLANDMERLLFSGEIDTLRVYRKTEIESLASATDELNDEAGLVALLRQVTESLPLAHATIHVVRETENMTFNPKVVTTYPKAWIERYVARKYARIDPVFSVSSERIAGFYWDIIDRSNPIVDAFFKDAESMGIGRSGYTLPSLVWHGAKVAISVTSMLTPDDFRRTFEPMRSDFEMLADDLLSAYSELAAQEFPPERVPPERLLRLLYGLAHGKTMRELSEQFGIGDIEEESRAICEFYDARTLLQAVMICTRLNHLESLPFDRWEIASDADEEAETVDF